MSSFTIRPYFSRSLNHNHVLTTPTPRLMQQCCSSPAPPPPPSCFKTPTPQPIAYIFGHISTLPQTSVVVIKSLHQSWPHIRDLPLSFPQPYHNNLAFLTRFKHGGYIYLIMHYHGTHYTKLPIFTRTHTHTHTRTILCFNLQPHCIHCPYP